MNWKSGMLFVVGAFVVAGALLLTNRETVQGQGGGGKGGMGGPGGYSVVSTDGAHLIVTDNAAAKLYFYAIDKDGKVGDDLKLRGSLDLKDVGKASMKPIDAKPQK
jgi:hypothetical protein